MASQFPTLYSLLTEEDLKELGEVDESWFETASENEKNLSCDSNLEKSKDGEEPGLPRDNSLVCKNTVSSPTAARKSVISREDSPLMFGFSPITCENGRELHWQHDPSDHITLSLGATMGGHDLSWTSSMATPVAKGSVCSHRQHQNLKFSKKLFDSQLNQSITEEPNLLDNDDSGLDSVIMNCDKCLETKCGDKCVMTALEEHATSEEIVSGSKHTKCETPLLKRTESENNAGVNLCESNVKTEKKNAELRTKKSILNFRCSNAESGPNTGPDNQLIIHADSLNVNCVLAAGDSPGVKHFTENKDVALTKHEDSITGGNSEAFPRETSVKLACNNKTNCQDAFHCETTAPENLIHPKVLSSHDSEAVGNDALSSDVCENAACIEMQNPQHPATLTKVNSLYKDTQNQPGKIICGTNSLDEQKIPHYQQRMLPNCSVLSDLNISSHCNSLGLTESALKSNGMVTDGSKLLHAPCNNLKLKTGDTLSPLPGFIGGTNCGLQETVSLVNIPCSLPSRTKTFEELHLGTFGNDCSTKITNGKRQMHKLHLEIPGDQQTHHSEGSHVMPVLAVSGIINDSLTVLPDEHNYAKLPQCYPDSTVLKREDHKEVPSNAGFSLADCDDDFDFNVTQHLEFAAITNACLKSMANDSLVDGSNYSSLSASQHLHPAICSVNNGDTKSTDAVVCEPCHERHTASIPCHLNDFTSSLKRPTRDSTTDSMNEIYEKDVSSVIENKNDPRTVPLVSNANRSITVLQKDAESSDKSVAESSRRLTIASDKKIPLPEKSAVIVNNQNDSTVFKGFETASGNKVSFSKSSLEKAKRLFSEEHLQHITESDAARIPNCESSRLSKNVWKTAEAPSFDVDFQNSTIPTGFNNFSISTTICQGFSTASGKKVAFSRSSLEKAKWLFSEENLPQIIVSDSFVPENCESSKVPLSKNSLETAKKSSIYANLSRICLPTVVNIPNISKTVCQGFSTASGKKVTFSKSALEKAKRLMSEEISPNSELDSTVVANCLVNKTSDVFRQDFISPEKLSSLGNNFKNEGRKPETSVTRVNPVANFQKIKGSISKDIQSSTFPFKGFSTASGRKMPVSADALEKARVLFSDVGLHQEAAINLLDVSVCSAVDAVVPVLLNGNNQPIKGSMLPVSSSNASTSNCTKDEFDCTGLNILQEAISISENPNLIKDHCFSTASCKKVTVSKAALTAAKTMFCDDDLSYCIDQQVIKTENQVVPQVVSDECNELMPDTSAGSFKGFATASGKSVHVSEAALKKAQNLFLSPSSKNANSSTRSLYFFKTVEDEHTSDHLANHQKSSNSSECGAVLSSKVQQDARYNQDGDTLCDQRTDGFTDVQESEVVHNVRANHGLCKFSTKNCSSELSALPDVTFRAIDGEKSADTSRKRSLDACSVTDMDLQVKRAKCCSHLTKNVSSRSLSFTPHEDKVSLGHSDISKPQMKLEAVPSSKVLIKGENFDVPDEFLNESFNMDDIVSVCPQSTTRNAKEVDDRLNPKELKSKTDPDRQTLKEAVLRDNSHNNNEMSLEILEITEAFLADDEIIASPNKNKSLPEMCLSPIVNYPTSANSKKCLDNENFSKNSTPNTSAIANHLCRPSASCNTSQLEATNSHCIPNSQLQSDFLMLSKRRIAAEEQMLRIAKRAKCKTAVVPSIRWQEKMCKERLHGLRGTVKGGFPCRLPDAEALRCGVKRSTLKVNSHTAKSYKFLWDEHFDSYSHVDTIGIVHLRNESLLIFDDNNMAGVKEFYRALIDTSGVDSKLISETWVANHYRWIIWKLAAMEVSFPKLFAGRLLTPNEVMLQLHYRYNREIDYCQHSALKKIMERDDTAAKTMILCVADISETSFPSNDSSIALDSTATMHPSMFQLEVTDGWYGIKAILDEPLDRLARLGKIVVGQKLIVHGADLIGPSDACSPLEAPSNLSLRLNANCCRIARWDLKLGYFPSPRPFALPLKFLYANGGLVGCVDIVVSRIFPVQYLEKRDDGTTVFYNEKTNSIAAHEFEIKKGSFMEKVLLEAESRFSCDEAAKVQKNQQSRKGHYSLEEIRHLTTGAEIFEALETSLDPFFIEDCLNSTQQKTLSSYKQMMLEEKRLQIEAEIKQAINNENSKCFFERNVIPLLKFRAVCCSPKNCSVNNSCIITLWHPTSNLESLIKEGKSLRIYYLLARSNCFRNDKELQLASTKKTKVEERNIPDGILQKVFRARQLIAFETLNNSDFKPLFGELDIIGVVVQVGYQEQSQFDFVYMADSNMNIAVIKFWGGLKSFGMKDVIKPKTFFCATNLQWRGRTTSSLIQYLYASQLSVFTQHPKEQNYKFSLDKLQHSVLNLDAFINKAVEKILSLVKKAQYRFNSPNIPFLGKPMSASTPLAGPLGSNIETVSSPNISMIVSEQRVQRLRLLEKYDAPPPLPTLHNQNSPHTKMRFIPPRTIHRNMTESS